MADNKRPPSPWQGKLGDQLLYIAAGLRPPLRPPEPLDPPKPPRKGPGGRPKALSKERLDDFRRATEGTSSTRRHFGQLLKAIAEINLENERIKTYDKIARHLELRPEYKDLSPRQRRRDVTEAITRIVRYLEQISPDLWPFGIEPPPKMTKKALREKALEFLRKELLDKRA
jgi:hypothetical protein